MKLLGIFKKKKTSNERIVSILICQNYFCVYVIDLADKSSTILQSIENITYSSGSMLLDKLDKCIYEIEEKLKITLSRCVFFVPTFAIHGGKLQSPYNNYMSQICKFMEFEPIGYMEISSLFANDLQADQNYIEYDKNSLYIYKVKQDGTLMKVAHATNYNSFEITLQEALHPGDIVYFYCAYHGIEGLLNEFGIIAKTLTPKELEIERCVQSEIADLDRDDSQVAPADEKSGPQAPTQDPSDTLHDTSNSYTVAPTLQSQTKSHNGNLEVFDIHALEDVTFSYVQAPQTSNLASSADLAPASHEVDKDSQVDSAIALSKSTQPSFVQNTNPRYLKVVKIVSLVLFIATTVLVLHEYFIHKTTISIYSPTKYDSLTMSDIQIKPEIANKSIQVKKTYKATGSAITGSYSKGKIAIFNFTDQVASFEAHTNLYSGNYKYEILENISVPSSKLNESDGSKTAGRVETELEATFYGADGDIPRDTTLTFADIPKSNVYAKTQTAITGGEKSVITAVSSDDIEKAKLDAVKQAKSQITSSLASAESVYFDTLATHTTSDLLATPKLGQAAVDFELSTTIQLEIPYSDLSQIAKIVEQKKGAKIAKIGDLKVTVLGAKYTDNNDNEIATSIEAHVPRDSKFDSIEKIRFGFVRSNLAKQLKSVDQDVLITYTDSCIIPICTYLLPLNSRNIQVQLRRSK